MTKSIDSNFIQCLTMTNTNGNYDNYLTLSNACVFLGHVLQIDPLFNSCVSCSVHGLTTVIHAMSPCASRKPFYHVSISTHHVSTSTHEMFTTLVTHTHYNTKYPLDCNPDPKTFHLETNLPHRCTNYQTI